MQAFWLLVQTLWVSMSWASHFVDFSLMMSLTLLAPTIPPPSPQQDFRSTAQMFDHGSLNLLHQSLDEGALGILGESLIQSHHCDWPVQAMLPRLPGVSAEAILVDPFHLY